VAPGGIILGIPWIITIPWFVFLARRWSQVRADVKLHSEGASRLCVFCTWVKCAWCTIDRNHKWWIYCLFGYLDVGWTYQVISLAIPAPEDKYVVSYGQVLSLFFAVPTLVSAAKFVYFRRLSLLHLLQRLPKLCSAEARYLLTGKEFGPAVQDSHLPLNITSHPERPVLGEPHSQIVTNAGSAHQPPVFPELDYAMWSGWG